MEQYARGAMIGELEPLNPTAFDKLHDALELGPSTKEGSDSSIMGFVGDCGGVHAVDDRDGCTPLHWVVRYDHTAAIVKALLKKGANADGLHKAQLQRRKEAEKSQARGAKVDSQGDTAASSPSPSCSSYFNDGVPTPLHEAARYDNAEIALILLEDGKADPNVPDRDGNRPLHTCAVWNNFKTAEVLLRYGADKSLANNDGQTPLDWGSTYEKIKALLA